MIYPLHVIPFQIAAFGWLPSLSERCLVPPEANLRIRELDGWRAVSILLVILHHAIIFSFPATFASHAFVSRFGEYIGELGVQTFFVISGFVITRLLLREEQQRGSISLPAFYIRRIFRILPIFLLVAAITALLSAFGLTPISRSALLTAVFFVKDMAHPSFDWFLGHTWSLAVEEQFYIVFPLAWILLSRSPVTAPRRRATVFLVTFFGFLAWTILSQWNLGASFLNRSAIVGFCCINFGVLFAIHEQRARRWAQRIPAFLPLLVAVFLLLRPLPGTPLGRSLYYPIVPIAIGLILAHTISRPGWVASLLKTPVLQWIGLVSYSAYLWQQLFTAHPSFYGSPAIARAFHLAIPAIFLIAAASYYGIELPIIHLGRRLSQRFTSPERIAASPFPRTTHTPQPATVHAPMLMASPLPASQESPTSAPHPPMHP